jgi:hypothetical protein
LIPVGLRVWRKGGKQSPELGSGNVEATRNKSLCLDGGSMHLATAASKTGREEQWLEISNVCNIPKSRNFDTKAKL